MSFKNYNFVYTNILNFTVVRYETKGISQSHPYARPLG